MASPLTSLTALLAGQEPDPPAWDTIRKHAARHGVAQMIAFRVRPCASPDQKAWCDRVLARSWQKHNQGLKDLDRTLAILDKAAIPTIALKGPLLALRHYDPPFLRKPSTDIDLAVKDTDLDRACEAVKNAGYTPAIPLQEARSRTHHLELHHPSQPPIELHFRLSHGAYGIPIEEFFERALPFRQCLILSPADEIFHLILHRAHGRFAMLFHLEEIRRLWTAATPEVRQQTLRLAVKHHFAGAFALTDIAFQVRWDERLLTDSDLPKTWRHSQIDKHLYQRFEALSDPGRELPLTARLARRWIDFQLTDSPADARRFAAIMLRIAWYQLRNKGWKTVKVM